MKRPQLLNEALSRETIPLSHVSHTNSKPIMGQMFFVNLRTAEMPPKRMRDIYNDFFIGGVDANYKYHITHRFDEPTQAYVRLPQPRRLTEEELENAFLHVVRMNDR